MESWQKHSHYPKGDGRHAPGIHADEWASLAHIGVASLHPRRSLGEELSIFTLSCAQRYRCHAPNQAVGGEMAERSPEYLKTESKR